MITPEPFSSIIGRSARSSRTAGNRFNASARCHSRSSRTANPPAGADDPPTTWAMISMPPSRARTASATAAHSSADVISAATKASISTRSPGAVRAVVSTVAPISHSRVADPLGAAGHERSATIQFASSAHERISSSATSANHQTDDPLAIEREFIGNLHRTTWKLPSDQSCNYGLRILVASTCHLDGEVVLPDRLLDPLPNGHRTEILFAFILDGGFDGKGSE